MVLDLASGEGFGAAVLARSAASVVGVDIDSLAVEHSRLNHREPNVSFAVGDARDLSGFEDHSFGGVVAFEMIEHIEDQERVLDEISRVLEPGGVLIMSTPDRAAYAEVNPENPFHVRELSADEFATLIGSRFQHVAMFGQRSITGSTLQAVGETSGEPAPATRTVFVQKDGDAWREADGLSPLYLIAVASNGELPAARADSTLADPGLGLLDEAGATVAQRLDQQSSELARLRAQIAYDASSIHALNDALHIANSKLARVEQSVIWQLFQRVRRRTFRMLGGDESRGVERLQAALRWIGRVVSAGRSLIAHRTPPPRPQTFRGRKGPIRLSPATDPEVSIVIPLYAHAELTEAALRSIAENTGGSSYEVILVDDSTDPDTKALLERVDGASVIVNDHNLGYLQSVKRGAEVAAGRWLVLCNNDIEVQPGWLPALLDCAHSGDDVGIVAPKFIYPDGTLCEAGGIIWRDGTGANYGRGGDPRDCHYEYRREIDYGSAAALMVRTDFWREVGGFDERFEPMYYEDTDLCFEARRRGLRVMYEPRAAVVHVEGATAGVDENASHKRHQADNRPKFLSKWSAVLETEHLESDGQSLWLAANARRGPRVLVVDHRVPTWDRDSGGLRMRGILEALRDMGCHVTLLPDNGLALQPYTRELERLGIEVLYGPDLRLELARIGASLSLVILSRAEAASRWLDAVREFAPRVPVAFDTVDLHWLREERRAALGSSNGADPSRRVAALREVEVGLIRATDATLVVSADEGEHVLADVPEAKVLVVPNVHRIRDVVRPPERRSGVLFVGGFEHPPNADGALTLVNDVMPLVWRESPEVTAKIVGGDPPDAVRELASERVQVAGWVPDLDHLLESSYALVAPLRFGAGLKGKVTQALAHGLPVVTTLVGAEGLDAVDGEHMLIAQTPDELAARVLQLLGDHELWMRLSSSGQQLVAAHCSPEVMRSRLSELLDMLVVQQAAQSAAAR